MANDLDLDKFIEVIRMRPTVWNKTDPKHRNADVTSDVWKEVADEMGGNASVAELKQKWHTLRNSFIRELRIAEAGLTKKKWMYYDKLSFLTVTISSKKPRTNVVKDDGLLPCKTETIEEINDFSNTDSNNSEFLTNKAIIDDFCQTKNSNPGVDTFRATGECSLSYGNPAGNCHLTGDTQEGMTITDNEDYHFAMSIIPHMRKVPMHRKLKMRISISQIIDEASGFSELPS